MTSAPYTFQINLTDEFKQKLLANFPPNKSKTIRMLNDTPYTKKGDVKASPTRWFNWFKYNDVNMPLWAAMGLCALADIPLEEMEKNIVFYKQKQTPNKVSVKNPILPIEFNPIFVSLASHFCFDGSLPKDGKGAYYSQKNLDQVDNFIEKAKRCFGEVYINISKDGKGVPKIRLPRFIGEICKHVCGFESFGTFDTRIPDKLMILPKEYKLAILVSAIVDEGHLSEDGITLLMKNKGLVTDLFDICRNLNYKCSSIKETKREAYRFTFKSIEKLNRNLTELKEKYPLLSLTFKIKDIQRILDYKNFPRGKPTIEAVEVRKKKITKLLQTPRTTEDIAVALSISPRSIRRILLGLVKESRITKTKRGQGYIYKLCSPFS